MPPGVGGHTKNICIRNLQSPNCGIFHVSQNHLKAPSVTTSSAAVAYWLVFLASAAADVEVRFLSHSGITHP